MGYISLIYINNILLDQDDYELNNNGRITLSLENVMNCINVTIKNDDIREIDDTLLLQPLPMQSQDTVTGGIFTITIRNDGDGENYIVSSLHGFTVIHFL